MAKENDVLEVLSSNTQNNNYNQGNSQDEELKVLNENTPKQNSFGISLTEEEENARLEASRDVNLGVPHEDFSNLNALKQEQRKVSAYSEPTQPSEPSVSGYETRDDGVLNTTATLAEDLVANEKNVDPYTLYKNTLGSTAYAELKRACGLGLNDSYTDYYNKTKFVPKGYEMESRLLLAEEKRMRYYADYASGKISKTDFLYQAYGKDLMKEAGYDVSSKLFWYNKIKNNDYTSPLDSDSFLSDLISNAEQLWQKETWFQEKSTKRVSETLAGLTTGVELEEEKFEEIFKTQVDALSEYFDNDIKKIMTYYQSGALGSAFSPFIDIDGDGKMDYYYHTDGKLYAVEGSSGTGASKCNVVYNDDGSIHSIEVDHLATGAFGQLLEGFRNFWVGFLDIGALAWNGTIGFAYGDFSENQQKWESWKRKSIQTEDKVIFDGLENYNADDVGGAICNGIGTVLGMICMLLITQGIGNALKGITTTANEGTKAGVDASTKLITEAEKNGVKEITKDALQNQLDDIVNTAANLASEGEKRRYINTAVSSLTKNLSKNKITIATKEAIKDVAGSYATGSVGLTNFTNALAKGSSVLVGQNGALNIASRAKGGNVSSAILNSIAIKNPNSVVGKVAGNIWARSIATATELGIRDFMTVKAELDAKNAALKYLEDATDGQVKALSEDEINGRAWMVFGTDVLVSTLFRAQGADGFTERMGTIGKMSDYSNNALLSQNMLNSFKDNTLKQSITNYLKQMKAFARVDSVFDIIENMTTAGAQAAFSNPYAKLGEKESWQTFWQSIASPQSIVSNIYALGCNVFSFGPNTSIYDDRLSKVFRSIKINSGKLSDGLVKLDTYLSTSKDHNATEIHNALTQVKNRIDTILNDQKLSLPEATLKAAKELDSLFGIDANSKNVETMFDLTSEQVKQVRQTVKKYNKDNPDEQIGMATGYLFNEANKANDEAVAAIYGTFINQTKEQAKARVDKWKNTFKGILALGNPIHFLKSIDANKSEEAILSAINAINRQIVGEDRKIGSILDGFVSRRFKTFEELAKTDANYAKFLEKQGQEIEKFFNSGLVKMDVFTDDCAVAATTLEIEKDPDNPDKHRLKNAPKDTSNLSTMEKMFINYDQNKEAIEFFVSIGAIGRGLKEDGSEYFTINDGNPQFYIELDASKHNEFQRALKSNKSFAVLYDILLTTSLMFEKDMGLFNMKVPPIKRLDIADGTANNPNAKTTIFVIANPLNSGIVEPVQRLQATQRLLYDLYALRTIADTGEIKDSSVFFKLYAEIGNLLDDNKVYDPFFKSLEEYEKNPDSEENKNAVYNAIAIMLNKSAFNPVNGQEQTDSFFDRKALINLYAKGALPIDMLNEIVKRQSSEKSSIPANAAKVAKEMLDYIEVTDDKTGDIIKIKTALKNLNGSSANAKQLAQLVKEFATKIKTNEGLRTSLEIDKRLDDPIIKEILQNTEEFISDFLVGRRDLKGSYIDVLNRKLTSLDPQQRKDAIRNLIVQYLGNEEAFREEIKSENLFRELRKVISANIFGHEKKGKQVSNSRIFDSTIKNADDLLKFIEDPMAFVDGLEKTNISKKEMGDELFNEAIESIKDNLKAYLVNNKIDSNKLVMSIFVKDDISTRESLDNFVANIKRDPNVTTKLPEESIERFSTWLSIILGGEKYFDANKLEVKDILDPQTGNVVNTLITYDGKELKDLFFKNPNKISLIVRESLNEDKINEMVELTSEVYSYYYDGDNKERVKAKNVIEINVLEFLPENLSKAIQKVITNVTAHDNYVAAGYEDSNKLMKAINQMLAGVLSGNTASQYRVYMNLVSECILTGSWIKEIDMDPKSKAYTSFINFLKLCGYDNEIYDDKLNTNHKVPGVYVRDEDTININTNLLANRLFAIAEKYKGTPEFVGGKVAPKDYIAILRNLLGNYYITKDSMIDLADIYADAPTELIKTGDKAYDTYTNPIKVIDYIYSKKDNNRSYYYNNGYFEDWIARGAKGTLSGGEQASKYPISYRSTLICQGDNTELDVASYNTVLIHKMLDAAYQYLTSKHALLTFEVKIPKKVQQQFESLYNDPDRPNLFVANKMNDSTYVLSLNDKYKGNGKKNLFINDLYNSISKVGDIDLRQILPVWDPSSISMKYDEPGQFENLSLESLYTVISNAVEEFSSIKKLQNIYSYTSKKFNGTISSMYNFSDDEYIKYRNALNTFIPNHKEGLEIKVEDLIDFLSNNSEMKNNYFAKSQLNRLLVALDQTDFMKSKMMENDTRLFNMSDYKLLDKIGTYLNQHDNLLAKDYVVTDTDIESMRKELNLSKDYDVEYLISTLKDSEESLLVRLNSNHGIPAYDPLTMAFTKFLDIRDGKVTISLDYYAESNADERNAFKSFINYCLTNKDALELSAEEETNLKELIKTIDNLNDSINKIYQDTDIVNRDKVIRQVFEVATLNNPGFEVNNKGGIVNQGSLREDLRKQITKLASNQDLSYGTKKKFIKSSSLDLNKNINTNAFKRALNNWFNETVVNTSDKVGSVLVANAESESAIAEVLAGIITFSSATEDILKETFGLKVDPSIEDKLTKAVNELAIKAQALSTGVEIDSEYGGAQILRFNSKTGDYEVVPLVTSSSDENKSIFRYFLGSGTDEFNPQKNRNFSFSNINKYGEDEHIYLLKVSKNSFGAYSDNIDDNVTLIDLRNEETQKDILRNAVNKAIWDRNEVFEFNATQANIENILMDYYFPQTVTVKDIWSNIYNMFTNAGVDKEVVKTILPSIGNLSVSQDTSTTEQTIYDVVRQLSKGLVDKKENRQHKNLADAIAFGITRDSLEYEDEVEFRRVLENLNLDYEFTNAIDDAIKNKHYEVLANLSEEDKVKAIKYYLLTKLDGGALQLILNARQQSLKDNIDSLLGSLPGSLEESLGKWKSSQGQDINILNAVTKLTSVMYDGEWKYNKNNQDKMYPTYQLAFTIRKPLPDTDYNKKYDGIHYNILIGEGLNAIEPNQELSIEEDQEAFGKKFEAYNGNKNKVITLNNISAINESYLVDGKYYLVDSEKTAYKLFEMLCNAEGVKLIMGYNNKGKNSDDDRALRYISSFFKDKDNIDVMNDVHNGIYSSANAKFNSSSLDYAREKMGETSVGAHDASVDIDFTLKYDLWLINNAVDTNKFFSSNINELKEIFGGNMTDDEYNNVLSKVQFDEIKSTSKKLEGIYTSMFSNHKRTNENLKLLLDSLNTYQEYLEKRTYTKQLNDVVYNVIKMFDTETSEAYVETIKNKFNRDERQKIVVGLLNSMLGDRTQLGILLNDKSNDDLLKKVFTELFKVTNFAVSFYKNEYKKSHNAKLNESVKLKSNAEFEQMFWQLPTKEIESYILKAADYIIENKKLNGEESYDVKDDDINLVRAIKENYSKSIPSKVELEALTYNGKLYNVLKDDTRKIIDVNQLEDDSNRVKLKLGVVDPVLNAFGINQKENRFANSMDDDLQKHLALDILKVFGTTEENAKNIEERKKTLQIGERRKKLIKLIDSYEPALRELFFDKDTGLLTKKLKQQKALWTMGKERLTVTDRTGELGVIYIGKTLLSSKAFPWTNLASGMNIDDEFYSLVWRQPLQTQANVQMVKIKIVEGSGFSMSKDTAANYFNGDFDGDHYFFAEPKLDASYQKAAEEVWKVKTIPDQIFNILLADPGFEKNKVQKDYFEKHKTTALDILKTDAEINSLLEKFVLSSNEGDYLAFRSAYTLKLREQLKGEGGLSQSDLNDLCDEYISSFGAFYVKTSHGGKAVSFNPHLKEVFLGKNSLDKICDAVIANAKTYFNDNIYDTKIDAPEIGIAAKNLRNKLAANQRDPSKIFFQSLFAMKGDNVEFINRKIKLIKNDALDNTITKINDYVDSLESGGYITSDIVPVVKGLINKRDDEGRINAHNLLLAAQLIQQDSQINGKEYKRIIGTYMPDIIEEGRQQDEKIVNALAGVYKMLGYSDEQIDVLNKSGCALMMAASTMYKNMLSKDQLYGQLKFSNEDNSAIANIYNDLVTSSSTRLIVDRDKDYEVITNAERISLRDVNGKSKDCLGLGHCYIAVDEDSEQEDSLFINKNCKDLQFYKPAKIKFEELTKEQKIDFIKYIKSKVVSGNDELEVKELNRILKADFDPDYTYRYCGTVSKLNSLVNVNDLNDQELNKYFQTVIIKESSLVSMASNNQVKIGMVGSKSFKGTVDVQEFNFGKVTNTPQFVMSRSLFDNNKTNINADIESAGTIYTTDGKKYTVYRCKDLALLNGNTLDAQSRPDDKYFDTIGIVQGGHNLDAAFAFGDLFISCTRTNNGASKWTYDPTGYNALRDALSDEAHERKIYDRNAAHSVRTLRLAYMIESFQDKNLLSETIAKLTFGKILDPKEYLRYVYRHGDLAGDYGDYQEAILYNALRNSGSLGELSLKINNKNDILARVAFSEEMNSQFENRFATYFDEDEDQIITSKFQRPNKNIRVSNTKPVSGSQSKLANLTDSGDDYSNSYVSSIGLLRTIVEESGNKFNIQTLKNAIENGSIDLVTGKLGYLNNGFHFMDEGRYHPTDDDYEEKASAIKSGSKQAYDYALQVKENQNLYQLPTASRAENFLENDDKYSLAKDVLDGYGINSPNRYVTASHIMPLFTDGSQDQIYDAQNLWANKFNFNILRRVYTLSDDQSTIVSNLDVTNPKETYESNGLPLMNAEQARNYIKDNSKSPKLFKLTEAKQNYFKENFDHKTIQETYSALSRDELEFEATKTGKFLMELADKYNGVADNYNYLKAEEFNINNFITTNIINNPEQVIKNISVYSDDNGISLVNSWLKSWGFKAKGNKDIALGNQTIRLRQKVNNIKQELLGNEYGMLHLYASNNQNLTILLNKYMSVQRLIDSYEEIMQNDKVYKKKMSDEKYIETVKAINDKMKEYGFTNIEEMRQAQTDLLNNNVMLSNMVNWASIINLRLYKEAKKQDPYAIIGWICSLDNNDEDKKFVGHEYIKANTIYKERFIEGIQYEFENPKNKGKIASLFSNDNVGYLGMIEHIANQMSVAKTIDSFSTFMKQTGYMKNNDTYAKAHEILNKEIQNLFTGKGLSEIDTKENEGVNSFTFYTIKNLLIGCGVNPSAYKYKSINDIYLLYKDVQYKYATLQKAYNTTSESEITRKIYEAGQDESKKSLLLREQEKVNNLYESTLSVIVNMIKETTAGKKVLENIYTEINNVKGSNKVLVDSQGKKLENKDNAITYNSWRMFDYLVDKARTLDETDSDRQAYIAIQALKGNVYLMDDSVADQLEKKVFSTRVNSKINAALKKAKNLLTSGIMCTPVSLIDRIVNFPFFDAGVVGSADYGSFKSMPQAIATVNKYMAIGNTLTDEQVLNDPNMLKLVRFIAASDNNPLESESFRGENLGGQGIPLVRKYIKAANKMYNAGNLIPRFAYYLDIVNDAEANDYKLNPLKLGVVYHMADEIDKIQCTDDTLINSYLYNRNKDAADLDAKIVQVVAEHNGMEGNMPYAANWLNQNYNTMFLTFPMALLRWGKNRLQSLGYALTDISNSTSQRYLLKQAGSILISQIVLLAIQMLLSESTRKYLFNKKEELTDEEEKNAQNILFRGGMVKLFTSAVTGEETTTSSHSRGPVASLFDSYVADYVPAYNNGQEFGKTLHDQVMQHTLGHMNFAVKDVVESIPGNTFFQSTGWYSPDENFWENYGRKVTGYALGSSQANSFYDYMENSTQDKNELDKFANAMEYAYTNKYANTKESKSEQRNYKKAFSLVYDYFAMLYGESEQKTNTTKKTNDLKSDLKNAIEHGTNATDVYNVIYDYIGNGATFEDIKKALNQVLLVSRVSNMDYSGFMNSLTDSEKNIVKSALLYEQTIYPFADEVVDFVNSKATTEFAKQNDYTASVGSLLKTMSYNTPKNYNYYSNRRNYNNTSNYLQFINQFVNNANYNNRYNNLNNPMEAYNKAEQNKKYGTSYDVYGNRYTRYTNTKGDKWTYDVSTNKEKSNG